MSMPQQLDQQTPEKSGGILPESVKKHPNKYVAGLLGGVGLLVTIGEVAGVKPDSDALEFATTSARHPVLGYIGAWAATSALKNTFLGKFRKSLAFTGATLANFAAEGAQTRSPTAIPEYASFWEPQNLVETFKDYGFALTGMGLFLGLNKHQDR